MNQAKQNDDSESSANKSESADGIENATDGAVAATAPNPNPNQQQTADIFKLDIDCFEEAFDFLPFRDLVAMGQTCKLLQRLAGYCFHQNYLAIDKKCGDDGISVFYNENVNCFIPFINKLCFEIEDGFQKFRKHQSKFKRLKQITFTELVIAPKEAECVKGVLSKLEFLRMNGCAVEGDFYEMILVFCVNLKELIITENTFRLSDDDTRNDWLTKKYPTLVHLEIEPSTNRIVPELLTFFELNPSVQAFSTGAFFSLMNREAVGRAQLDTLAIVVDYFDGVKFGEYCTFLNGLHEKGVFKRLHLYFPSESSRQELIDKIATLKSLTKLYISYTDDEQMTLPFLNDLEEICIDRPADIVNLTDVATKFPKLHRVCLSTANSDEMFLFVQKTVRLKKLKVKIMYTGIYFDHNESIIDLVAMNKERRKLTEPQKVTIYVHDEVYIATKRALGETAFSEIIMRRGQSYEWKHSFFYYN